MKVNLKISEEMTNRGMWPGSAECRLLRLPMEARNQFCLPVDSFVNMRSKDGSIITLRIAAAFSIDADRSNISGYVTADIFDILELENIDGCDQDITVVDGITFGCDPEFFLIDKATNKLVKANTILRKVGEVGSDGSLIELRPIPSPDEGLITDTIYKLIKKARFMVDKYKKHEDIKFYSASHYRSAHNNILTAGFHLHFGLPKQLLGIRNKDVVREIVKVLDYYVGVPCVIPEGASDSYRRATPFVIYGKPGSYRIDSITMEYRVPGGALLKHPTLTRGVIGLGAMVVEDVVSRIKEYTDGFNRLDTIVSDKIVKDLYPNMFDVVELFRTIGSISTAPAMNRIESIANDLSQMVSFRKREDSVNKFLNVLFSGTMFGNDMENNWEEFYNDQQSKKMEFLSAQI